MQGLPDLTKLSRRLNTRDRLRAQISNGERDPVFRIGRMVSNNPFYPLMEDELVNTVMKAEESRFFEDKEGMEASKLLDLLQHGANDEDFLLMLHEMFQRDATSAEQRKKNKMKWYRLASKLVDNIPQFVSQFQVPMRLLPDPQGTSVLQKWRNQSPVEIVQRQYLDDPDLPQIMDLNVRQRMKSTDFKSVETIVLDISGSMFGDSTTMALLYIFNRIQHCREGDLSLQIVLFDTATTRIGLRTSRTPVEYIFDVDRMTPEDFDRLEELVYEKARPCNGTDLMQALRFIDSPIMDFVDVHGNKMRHVVKTYTIVTDDGSSVDEGFILKDTKFNALLAYSNRDLINLARRTGGYHNTLHGLLQKIQGK